jgi:hypothetical protein
MDAGKLHRLAARVWRKALVLATRGLRAVPGARHREAMRYARIESILHRPQRQGMRPPGHGLPPVSATVRALIAGSEDYRVIFLNDPGDSDRQWLEHSGIRADLALMNRDEDRDPFPFQVAALTQRAVEATCPWTGRHLTSVRGVIAAETQPIFYRFVGGASDELVFYLAVGREGTGFARLYLYIPALQTVLFLVDRAQWNGRGEIDEIRAFLVEHWRKADLYFRTTACTMVCALMDSRHFAHYIWETLTGMDGWISEERPDQPDSIIIAAEPLTPFETLFPEVPHRSVERIAYPQLPLRVLGEHRLLVRLGKTKIGTRAVERMLGAAREHAGEEVCDRVNGMRARCWPILWATIRTHNRTWVSQQTGIAAIANALLATYPRLGLIIDGFVVPHGLPGDPAEQGLLIGSERRCVAAITGVLDPSIEVHSNVGESLASSLVYAVIADCYLAHQGSLQHKIAWARNCPGVVHSNRAVLTAPPGMYPGVSARDDAILPIYLDPDRTLDRDGAEDKPNLRWPYELGNYDFDYRDALTALETLFRGLPPAPSADPGMHRSTPIPGPHDRSSNR